MEEKNLAQHMKNELKETNIYYKNVKLELSKIRLENVIIEEKHKQEVDENNQISEKVEYGILIMFKGENIKIATINQEGTLIPNKDILKDEKYSSEELNALGDMINRLGLEQEKVDINELKQQLSELEAKKREEIEQEMEEEREETAKDDNEKDEEKEEEGEKEQEEDNKDLEGKDDEEEKNKIATRKNISSKNIFILRRDSQFYENYPHVPKTTYFYRDNDGKIKAEYIDEKGQTQPSEFFNDSTTTLKEQVIGLRNDGEPVKEEIPYQVMTTQGLTNTNRNARDIRIAIYIENGYMEFEEVRQGDNGKWTGYGLEANGRDYNSKIVNELSNTKTNSVEPGEVSDRYEAVEHTGLADDGIQMQDLSPMATIERFMDEGYNKDEAIDIYNYMIGEEHLSEEAAKERVNEEIVERIEKDEREVEDSEKTPWGDAWARRDRR